MLNQLYPDPSRVIPEAIALELQGKTVFHGLAESRRQSETRVLVSCVGYIDSVTSVEGIDAHVLVQGWVVPLNGQGVFRYNYFTLSSPAGDEQDIQLHTGILRADVAGVHGLNGLFAGFRGIAKSTTIETGPIADCQLGR
jgi:hypothetical protein